MSKVWKIKNISENKIKFSISLGGANNPGVILDPGEMVLSQPRLTGPLDKQRRSGFLEIDEDFDNSKLKLPIGVKMRDIDEVIKNVDDYSEK